MVARAMTVAIGIDSCKRGWFYFRFEDGVGTFGAAEKVADILTREPQTVQRTGHDTGK